MLKIYLDNNIYWFKMNKEKVGFIYNNIPFHESLTVVLESGFKMKLNTENYSIDDMDGLKMLSILYENISYMDKKSDRYLKNIILYEYLIEFTERIFLIDTTVYIDLSSKYFTESFIYKEEYNEFLLTKEILPKKSVYYTDYKYTLVFSYDKKTYQIERYVDNDYDTEKEMYKIMDYIIPNLGRDNYDAINSLELMKLKLI